METFKIVITETITRIEDEQEYKKLADSGNQSDGGAIFGYVLKPSVTKTKEHIVLHQEVEDLDLIAVIKAINGIK